MNYPGMLTRARDPGGRRPQALDNVTPSQLLLSISCSFHKFPNRIIQNCSDPSEVKYILQIAFNKSGGGGAFCKLLILPFF